MKIDDHTIDFVKRTLKHIRNVQDCAVHLIENHRYGIPLTYGECTQLLNNIIKHDHSKFSDKQFEPYIKRFNRFKSSDNCDEFERAWENHYTVENHHWDKKVTMSKLEQIEMVCDWSAMSIEFQEEDCTEYFEEMVKPNNKNYFDNDFVYRIIEMLRPCTQLYL